MKTKTKIVAVTALVLIPLFFAIGFVTSKYNVLPHVVTKELLKS